MSDTTTPEAGDPGLLALEAQAHALEGENAPPPPPGTPEPVTAEQTAGEIYDGLQMVRGMFAPAMDWWPEFGVKVWTDAQLMGIAVNGAKVMERHGWTFGEVLADWGPYIGLAACTIPPSLATVHAFKRRDALAKAPPAPAQAAAS